MVVFLPESNVMGSEDASRENWAHDYSVSGGVTYCGLSVEEVEVTSWLWMCQFLPGRMIGRSYIFLMRRSGKCFPWV